MRTFYIGLLFGLTSLVHAQQSTESSPMIEILTLNLEYDKPIENISEDINSSERKAASIIDVFYPTTQQREIYDAVGKSYADPRTKKDVYQVKCNIQKGINYKPGVLIKNSEGNNWMIIDRNEMII